MYKFFKEHELKLYHLCFINLIFVHLNLKTMYLYLYRHNLIMFYYYMFQNSYVLWLTVDALTDKLFYIYWKFQFGFNETIFILMTTTWFYATFTSSEWIIEPVFRYLFALLLFLYIFEKINRCFKFPIY